MKRTMILDKDIKAFFKEYTPENIKKAYERGLITLNEAIQAALNMERDEIETEVQYNSIW